MLTIKNRIELYILRRLVRKRNKEFLKGHYEKSAYYGELANNYLAMVLDLEEGTSQ